MRRAGKLCTFGAALAALLLCACSDRSPFECGRDDQCVRGDESGVCESVGFCSFADATCPEGRRFADNAGGGLAGECSATAECGDLGEACCEPDVCGAGLACDSASMCVACIDELAPGRRHSCAVRYDGTIWCWGDNDRGQLGSGDASIGTSGPTPVQVVDDSGAALTGATHVAGSFDHSCAVVAGAVRCWGANDEGKLGDGDTAPEPRGAAVEVIEIGGEPLADIVEVGVSDSHSCALASSGQVFCWGRNDGRLGDGLTLARATAAPVVAVGGEPLADATELSVNGAMACVRAADNRISCWGENKKGETGVGHQLPVLEATEVFTGTDVAVGRRHTCAVTDSGGAMCWGEHWRGTLGNSDDPSGPALVPVEVLSIEERIPVTDVAEVAAGAVGCYRSAAGEVYCWGPGSYGQVGAGAGSNFATLVVSSVGGAPLSGVVRLANQHSRVCAYLDDGRILCWGRNSEGQLGDGTTENRGFPTEVQCP